MHGTTNQRAIIIGAGPAGLTAAYELLMRTGIRPIVLEKSEHMGGLARTVNYKGNRIDIGGHRFFSKSDRVLRWWLNLLPLEASANGSATIQYHGKRHRIGPANLEDSPEAYRAPASLTALDRPRPGPSSEDRVMLLRPRKSRIYYLRRFFDYPITFNRDTLLKLGFWRTIKIGAGYLRSALFPIAPEETLEQFLINRFGDELYRTFFKSYTEKVWGVPCNQIGSEWGAQRIQGLSVWSALTHAVRKMLKSRRDEIGQKNVEASLIEEFLYPRFGPGQMWDEAAQRIREMGGEILTGYTCERILTDGVQVTALEARNSATGNTEVFTGDYFFSTAPVKEIMRSFDVAPAANVLEVSDGLAYRNFITVGLLLPSLLINESTATGEKLISDNWIYIQEPDVLLGRLQIYNNWSPCMVADSKTVWLGLEYFCNDSDDIWKMSDEQIAALARAELSKIGIIDSAQVIDSTVLRMEKAYPAYLGTYARFAEIREHVDRYTNLFLIGRNGMHRYNNQDHSMLAAMVAVDEIVAGTQDKSRLWELRPE